MADRIITFARADSIIPKPTSWLIEDWLVTDSLAGLVGPSGSGMTFLALDWAARTCIAILAFATEHAVPHEARL